MIEKESNGSVDVPAPGRRAAPLIGRFSAGVWAEKRSLLVARGLCPFIIVPDML